MLSDQEHIQDDQLQMYFDAELSDGESTIVRRHLVGCTECKGRLRAMEQLHSFFEMAAEDVSADLPSEEMFAKIKAGLAESGPALRPIEGGATSTAPAVSGGSRRNAWVPIAVGFAVAAAVLIGVLVSGQNDAPEQEARPRQQRRAPEVLVQETDVSPPPGTSVHDVDFGENTGTVFQVEGEGGGSLAVVWINDDVPGEDGSDEVPQ